MFLAVFQQDVAKVCFPRIRGDVPEIDKLHQATKEFSPHTRGCSTHVLFTTVDGLVFPAYAGMFRRGHRVGLALAGFPRIRGDVPWSRKSRMISTEFSPHTRGCSDKRTGEVKINDVFPAYAGMFRCTAHHANQA